jgi:hypothetical protein
MKRMKLMISKTKLLTLAIAIIFFASCGEDVDPTQGEASIVMKARTSLGTINPGARVADNHLEFTSAMLGITKLELETNSGLMNGNSDDDDDDGNKNYSDDDEYEIEIKGQFIADLLTGTVEPDFGISSLFPGTYKEIEITLRPIMDDGNSVFIAFTYRPTDGEPIDIEISSMRELEFEAENKNGIQIDGNTINQILILFDLDKLIEGIDFSKLNTDEDGVLRINDKSNQDIANILMSKLDDSCGMGKDDDRDDKFDDDDDDEDDD